MNFKTITVTVFFIGVLSTGPALAGGYAGQAHEGWLPRASLGQNGVAEQDPNAIYPTQASEKSAETAMQYSWREVAPQGQRGVAEQESLPAYAGRVQEGSLPLASMGQNGVTEQDPSAIYPTRTTTFMSRLAKRLRGQSTE
jgi:hypothetical protein